jgi:hypothetical protein
MRSPSAAIVPIDHTIPAASVHAAIQRVVFIADSWLVL